MFLKKKMKDEVTVLSKRQSG